MKIFEIGKKNIEVSFFGIDLWQFLLAPKFFFWKFYHTFEIATEGRLCRLEPNVTFFNSRKLLTRFKNTHVRIREYFDRKTQLKSTLRRQKKIDNQKNETRNDLQNSIINRIRISLFDNPLHFLRFNRQMTMVLSKSNPGSRAIIELEFSNNEIQGYLSGRHCNISLSIDTVVIKLNGMFGYVWNDLINKYFMQKIICSRNVACKKSKKNILL